MSLEITLLHINEDVVRLAAIINEVVNVRYDSIHAALMFLNNIPTIITNDLDGWLKIRKSLGKILERLREEGYMVTVTELQVVSPKEYKEWRKSIVRE